MPSNKHIKSEANKHSLGVAKIKIYQSWTYENGITERSGIHFPSKPQSFNIFAYKK